MKYTIDSFQRPFGVLLRVCLTNATLGFVPGRLPEDFTSETEPQLFEDEEQKKLSSLQQKKKKHPGATATACSA